MKYSAFLWWSEEDQTFVAEAPDLPGCTAHGATRDEALRELELAANGWLTAAPTTPRRQDPADALLRLRDDHLARQRVAAKPGRARRPA